MTNGETDRIDVRTLADLHRRFDLLYSKIDTEVARVEHATFQKLDTDIGRVTKSLDDIQKTLSGRMFVRSEVFDEIRKSDERWREMQEETNRENREWRTRMNLALITAIVGFVGQVIFFVLTRK